VTLPAFLEDPALRTVLAAIPRARLVGGCVRDHLAGLTIADIDLATPDTPETVMQALAQAGLRTIPTGLAHGTVTALVNGHGFEITTLRRDIETDGRHAVVAFTDDWRVDAARRDFTINAMSMSPDGTLFDYFDGAADLAAGRVRFVGEAALRIAEDHLRILRFFRFFARYGGDAPDPQAVAAISAAVSGLAQLSAERVWSELRRILSAPTPDAAVTLMNLTGVLAAVLPGASPVSLDRLPADPLLRLAALMRVGVPGLKLSGDEAARLAALQGPPPPADIDEAGLRRLLADTPAEILIGRSWLAGRDAAFRDRIAAMPEMVFPVQGRDLASLGMKPGPEMGHALRRLRALWLASGCTASRAELLAAKPGP
jgi:poly(A) polymerase/tRNA nucleotidyltransferase (CCA-adding enzyme)